MMALGSLLSVPSASAALAMVGALRHFRLGGVDRRGKSCERSSGEKSCCASTEFHYRFPWASSLTGGGVTSADEGWMAFL